MYANVVAWQLHRKHLAQLWFQISSHGMHSKEAIETMDMPRRFCISFEQMQDNICILFTLILIPMEDIFSIKKMVQATKNHVLSICIGICNINIILTMNIEEGVL